MEAKMYSTGGIPMGECFVSFSSVKDVHAFVTLATRQIFPLHVEDGQMHTDGKSIMSLCCMGLNRPLRVRYPLEEQGFLRDVAAFLI